MKKEKLKMIASLGAGIIIGGAAGILFAPRKGSETRAKIKETFIEFKKRLNSLDEEKIKQYVEKKLDELDKDITKLELEVEYKKARKLAKKIITKINKLIKFTKSKGALEQFEDLIEDLKEKANEISEEILTNLED